MKKRLISMTTAILPSEMLSLMTITRALQPHHPGRQAHRRCDPCAGELIGAVTRVIVKGLTVGYGIYIQNILDAAEKTGKRGRLPTLFPIQSLFPVI